MAGGELVKDPLDAIQDQAEATVVTGLNMHHLILETFFAIAMGHIIMVAKLGVARKNPVSILPDLFALAALANHGSTPR